MAPEKKLMVGSPFSLTRLTVLLGFIASVLFYGGVPVATTTVSSLTQLKTALAAAAPGDTILLQGGNYGTLEVRDLRFAGQVTIASASATTPAHFDNLTVRASENLRFVGVDVGRALAAGEPNYVSYATVVDSKSIAFEGSTFRGNMDGNLNNDGIGLGVTNSSFVTVTGSTFTELFRGGTFTFSADLNVAQNTFKNLAVSGNTFAQVTRLVLDGNYYGGWGAYDGYNHPDAVQFMTAGTNAASTDIVIKNNVILQGGAATFQGIFVNDETGVMPYKNVLIQNNLVYTDQYNGISVLGGENVTIVGNSVLSQTGDSVANRIWMLNVNGGYVHNNIADAYIWDNVTATRGTNYEIGLNNASNLAFPNLNAGATATVQDLVVPVVGFQPLSSMEPTPAPTPTTDPVPATAPAPAPAPPPPPPPPTNVFGTSGSDTVAGTDGANYVYGLPSLSFGIKLGVGTIDRLSGLGGADVFVLGDSRGAFYDDGRSRSAGRTDYAQILDFQAGVDKVQLAGNVSNYQFRAETVAGLNGLSVYRDSNGNGKWDTRDELIGHVVNLSTFAPEHFVFG